MIELNLREKWVDQMYGGNLTTWCIWIVHAIEAIRSPDEKEIEIKFFYVSPQIVQLQEGYIDPSFSNNTQSLAMLNC